MPKNNLPQIAFVYDRYKKATSNKKAVVEIRISHNYKQKYISTGIMLYPRQWKNGTIVNAPDMLQMSQTLDKMVSGIRQVILDMVNEGSIDIYSIPQRLSSLTSTITFLEYCKQRMAIKKYDKTKGTIRRYDTFIKHFDKWNGIRTFSDINEENIIRYDNYMKKEGMKAVSRWGNYHKFLNLFIIDAIKDGHIAKNPYKWVNIDRGRSSTGIERYLTPEEFRKIKTVNLPTKSLERVRDVFVFQTYTCLSYSDLRDFDYRMVQEVKGVNVYVGTRLKTNITFTIPLLSPALDILYRYEGKLPIISNVKYNEYLKIVAQAAGIDKPISSHWARHTGATLLLNEGVPINIVSKICGHSSTKITERVYAKLLDETVVDALQGIDI